jgi:hypothetical protein
VIDKFSLTRTDEIPLGRLERHGKSDHFGANGQTGTYLDQVLCQAAIR